MKQKTCEYIPEIPHRITGYNALNKSSEICRIKGKLQDLFWIRILRAALFLYEGREGNI